MTPRLTPYALRLPPAHEGADDRQRFVGVAEFGPAGVDAVEILLAHAGPRRVLSLLRLLLCAGVSRRWREAVRCTLPTLPTLPALPTLPTAFCIPAIPECTPALMLAIAASDNDPSLLPPAEPAEGMAPAATHLATCAFASGTSALISVLTARSR